MKNSIVIGPILKVKSVTKPSSVLRERISKLKVGNFFEISGIVDPNDTKKLRAAVGYFAKKENVKVSTAAIGKDILKVERVASIKTKESSKV
jgi:hypothetical protein